MMINGRTYGECIAMLKAMRPKKEDKGNTGFQYYPIETYMEAMDEVFGNGHYNIAFSEPYYRAIGSGQEMITVRCTVTVISDEGITLKRVDGMGDKEIAYAKANGRADVGNLTSSAATAAFKDACKYLGIFGCRTGDKQPESKAKQETAKPAAAGKEKKPDETLNLVVSDMFYQQGEVKGHPVWKLPVARKDDKSQGEVVFYHNQTAKKAEKFNELLTFVENGLPDKKGKITLKLLVTPSGEFKGMPQYVFKDFA